MRKKKIYHNSYWLRYLFIYQHKQIACGMYLHIFEYVWILQAYTNFRKWKPIKDVSINKKVLSYAKSASCASRARGLMNNTKTSSIKLIMKNGYR